MSDEREPNAPTPEADSGHEPGTKHSGEPEAPTSGQVSENEPAETDGGSGDDLEPTAAVRAEPHAIAAPADEPSRRRFKNPLLSNWGPFAFVSMMSLIVAVALIPASWIGEASFRADISGSGAQFTVPASQSLLGDVPPRPASMTIERVDELSVGGDAFEDLGRVELEGLAVGGATDRVGVQLGALVLDSASTIQVLAAEYEAATDLYLIRGGWEGAVWLDSVRVQLPERGFDRVEADPDAPPGLGPSLRFRAVRGDSVSSVIEDSPRIRIRGSTPWNLTTNFVGRDVFFWLEEPDGRSLVDGGTLRVSESILGRSVGGETVELSKGDKISLRESEGRMAEFRIADRVDLRIAEGRAKDIQLEESSQRSSLLIRLYRLEGLRVVLAVFAGILSIWAAWGAVFQRIERRSGG